MKVCIAEKPSVAKEIAEILGAKSKKNGFFEGNGYQVTWTFGHLCTLKEPNDYDPSLKRWSLFPLPIIPRKFGIKIIPNRGVEDQFNTIEKLVSEATEVINCGDAGQEGELIQRWVLQKAKCKAPIKRLWISSLTEEAIKDGFKKLMDGSDFDTLYHAGSSRAIGDWLLGINATRLFTLKYGQDGNVLSIGRVQTPTLAMIVERYKAITAFKSEKFWELKTVYRDVLFSFTKGKINTKDKALKGVEYIKDHPFTIKSFTQKEGKENVPKLFDLTSLQVECNKKLNLSAENTLKIAQSLYERKFITYPRVDTRFLPDDIYPTIKGVLASMKAYAKWTKELLNKEIPKTKQVFNNTKVTDHHAIIPTNVTLGAVSDEEKKVYDIIAKRFIANFYPACKVSKTEVLGEANQLEFKATGKEILDQGWRVIYGKENVDEDDKSKNQEDNQLLPNFTEGESGHHEPRLEEKKTSPPKYFTEATLLRAMETAGKQVDDEEARELMKENGIGRPSTRANIIETLFKRNYIKKEKKNILPTITGIQLIDTINVDLLKSASLTGLWEKNLRQIEQGEYSVQQFMSELKDMVQNLVKEVKSESDDKAIEAYDERKEKALAKKAKKTKQKEITCPKCQSGDIVQGKTNFGCSAFKQGCDFRIPIEIRGKKLSLNQVGTLIQKKKSPLIKGINTKEGKKNGHLILKPDYSLGFEEEKKKELKCPSCDDAKLVKGKKAYGCEQFRNGCSFVIPFEIMGKKLTQAQIEQLLDKKKTKLIKGFTDSSEQKVNGYLVVNEQNKVEFAQEA